MAKLSVEFMSVSGTTGCLRRVPAAQATPLFSASPMLAHSEEQRHVVVGQSPRLRHIMRLVDKLGRGNWPVLLLGETGTGKEVIARAIHNVRPSGPFVTIDCSSLVG